MESTSFRQPHRNHAPSHSTHPNNANSSLLLSILSPSTTSLFHTTWLKPTFSTNPSHHRPIEPYPSAFTDSGLHNVFYRQDLPQAALPVFRLLTGRFWGFSPRRGDTLHRSRSNLAGRRGPNLTLIGSGVGVYGPKTEKNRILPM